MKNLLVNYLKWDLINLNNCYGITDIVLFFHNIGNYHKQLSYKFITEKLQDGEEENMYKYIIFWKNSSVLVYDIVTSIFNKALLLLLRNYIDNIYDPYFLDFLNSSFNITISGFSLIIFTAKLCIVITSYEFSSFISLSCNIFFILPLKLLTALFM